jgi:hypothetical protein
MQASDFYVTKVSKNKLAAEPRPKFALFRSLAAACKYFSNA